MRSLKEIIVHCSATPAGRHHDAAEIRSWHVDGRGWSDIGYHFVILLDGTIEKGRALSKVGAHVAGHNTGTIGICYVGGTAKHSVNVPEDTRTPEQKKAIVKLIRDLVKKYPSIKKISGHDEYANKACPCFPAAAEYGHLVGQTFEPVRPVSDPRYQYLQRLLARTGRQFGLIDGIKGKRTTSAILDFQAAMHLKETGEFDAATVKTLRGGWEDQPELPKQIKAVVDDANKAGAKSSTNKAAALSSVTATALAAKPVIEAVNETKDGVSALLSAGPWVLLAIVGIGAGYYIWSERQRKAKDAAKALDEL